jgi:hypothetical protein
LTRSGRDSGSNINTSFGGIIFSNNNNSNLGTNLNQKNSNIPNTARQTVQSQSQVGNISIKDNTLQSNNTIKNVIKNDPQISQLISEKEKINFQNPQNLQSFQPSHPSLSEPKSPIDHSGLVLTQPLKHPGFIYKNNTPGVGSGNKSGDMLLVTKNQNNLQNNNLQNNKKNNQNVEIIETKFQPPIIRDSKTIAQQYNAMLQSNVDINPNNEHNGRKS